MGACSSNPDDYFNQLTPEQQRILSNSKNSPPITYARPCKQSKNSQRSSSIVNEICKYPLIQGRQEGETLPCMELLNQPGTYYTGQWKDGQPHGPGELRATTGLYFKGYFNKGVVECNDGIVVFPDCSSYRGQIRNNAFNGDGTFIHRKLKNEMKSEKKHEQDQQKSVSIEEQYSHTIYAGQWLNNKPHGLGKQTFPDMSTYEGQFVNGLKEGNGIFRWPNNKIYEGQFKKSQMDGKGKLYIKNSDINDQSQALVQYEGQFKQGYQVADSETTIKIPFGIYERRLQFGQIKIIKVSSEKL